MLLEDLVNEVLKKIGRNMLLFQQLEYLLKIIVANGKLSGYSSELENIKNKQVAKVNKQTMGQVAGQYIKNSNPDYESSEPEEINEPYFSFNFRIGCDSIYYETKKEALSRLVSERNELVHHLLPIFDSTSEKSCEELGIKLDGQSEKIRNEIKEMQSIVKALHDGKKQLASFLASEEGQRQWEHTFLEQKIAILLADIASQVEKSDGWTSMSYAGQFVKQHAPEELVLLKDKYAYKSLKRFILATEIFDICEEATPRGGNRVFYRLKSG